MAYTPTTWTTGDTITASALNKMEQGIAGAGSALIATCNSGSSVVQMNKTVQEIYDALSNGIPAYCLYIYGTPTTAYESAMWLAPIVAVYGYGYTESLRIVVSKPIHVASSVGGFPVPSTAVFYADGMNEYPTFLASSKLTSSAFTVSESIN